MSFKDPVFKVRSIWWGKYHKREEKMSLLGEKLDFIKKWFFGDKFYKVSKTWVLGWQICNFWSKMTKNWSSSYRGNKTITYHTFQYYTLIYRSAPPHKFNKVIVKSALCVTLYVCDYVFKNVDSQAYIFYNVYIVFKLYI